MESPTKTAMGSRKVIPTLAPQKKALECVTLPQLMKVSKPSKLSGLNGIRTIHQHLRMRKLGQGEIGLVHGLNTLNLIYKL